MAIKKDVELTNGVVLTYHRVVRIQSIVNHSSLIEVQSYISKQKRLLEKATNYSSDVYIEATYYNIPYDPELNVIKAYEYIKSLPEFEGAEDILDEDIPGFVANSDTSNDDDTQTEAQTN